MFPTLKSRLLICKQFPVWDWCMMQFYSSEANEWDIKTRQNKICISSDQGKSWFFRSADNSDIVACEYIIFIFTCEEVFLLSKNPQFWLKIWRVFSKSQIPERPILTQNNVEFSNFLTKSAKSLSSSPNNKDPKLVPKP